MSEDSAFSLKRLLVGKPIPSHLAHHERLSRVTGLAVLSSDALSSVAYATDFILATLVVAGVGAFVYAMPISLVIATLLAIVAFSYRQTIHAYPTGGGAYIVAKENIGPTAGLIAAASLLVDYTLTVAVSISAGVLAITSAFPAARSVPRRDVPRVSRDPHRRQPARHPGVGQHLRGADLFLRGQHRAAARRRAVSLSHRRHRAGRDGAAGERRTASADDVPAADGVCQRLHGDDRRRGRVERRARRFARPRRRTPRRRSSRWRRWRSAMFVGITVLAHAYKVVPNPVESGMSQLGRAIFGGPNILYYLLQAGTTLILVLAANTAYADFPRLASIVARDRYLPRQFMNQGDRLAFSNGILVLSAFAAILIVAFRGDTQSLLPLYMIGVFISFTLSQAGMVIHWRKTKEPGWKTSALINGFGALVTGIVLIIVAVTKTLEGAWIVLLLIPLIVTVFKATHRHYEHVASELTLKGYEPQTRVHNTVLIPIGGLQRAVVEALRYAETLSDDVRAIYVDVNPANTEQLRKDWAAWGGRVTLVVLPSPFRSLMEPLLEYIEQASAEKANDYVTVILPEFVPARWWQHLLHNQTSLLIKGALLFRPNIVVTSVPFHLSK